MSTVAEGKLPSERAASPTRTVAQNGREPAALRIPEGRGRRLLLRSRPWTASLSGAYRGPCERRFPPIVVASLETPLSPRPGRFF
jgi:hypothetical protein